MSSLSLEGLRQELDACPTPSLQELAKRLWRHGVPCRSVRLPPKWWQQPTDIESGLWVSPDQQDPPQLWLVQQRNAGLRLLPLQGSAGSAPPDPAALQLDGLSLWPALEKGSGPCWRNLLRYLQLVQASRRALPAAALRGAVWLLLPACLAAALGQQLPLALGCAVAWLSLGVGLLLDNQWQRLWRNRSQRQRMALGMNAMQRVMRLPLQVLQRYGGHGAMGLAAALQELGDALPRQLSQVLPAACLLAGSSLVLLLWQPAVGGISSVTALVWLAWALQVMRGSHRNRRQQAAHRATTVLRGDELIQTASSLRLAGAEQAALGWWGQEEHAAQRHQPRLDGLEASLSGMALAAAAAAAASAWLLVPPALRPAVVVLLALQWASCQRLSGQLSQLELLQPNWEASQLLLNSPTEWRADAQDPGPLRGDLAVEQLSFRYGPEQPLVLDGMSFAIAAGSFVAVVGPSGSGKSTLLRLLLGFEQPQQGRILVDGHDVAGLQHELLRPQIGTVLQDARLVGSTIFEVIAAGRAISVEQAWEAAERAGLGDDLRALPMGLQTLVPAAGSTLSGGQRQLLAIARALVGQPRLLLLDEPTSALDNRTQQHVLAGLEQLAITRILVAHRLSTVRQADQILVLEGGRLLQQGSYAALLAKPGLFAELMERQRI